MQDTLFSLAPMPDKLAEGAVILRGFAVEQSSLLMTALESIIAAAPLRHMVTPGGFTMSVAMTNCGAAGWVSDRKGYRYAKQDPGGNNQAWPAMPALFSELATEAAAQAGYPQFHPDACLINRYQPGARMTLHQDKNERDFNAPIVSVSLGLPAIFLFGGPNRTDKAQRIPLESGDVVVWGGPSRLFFHGINPLKDGEHAVTGRCRYNLTFRLAL